MRITSEQLVAGDPPIQVRNFLRRFRSAVISVPTVQEVFNLSSIEAKEFLRRMVKLGLLERSKHFSRKDRPAYEVSTPGLALANASAAKPITRKTANRALQEFMDRVRVINASDEYPYKIESVVLFGSMLSDNERLGDVDLAVELLPASPNNQEFDKRWNYRYFLAAIDLRHFYSDFDWIAWPATEILRFLKSRSRSLALHNLDDLMKMNEVPYRILHGDSNRLSAMIPGGLPV
jgi:predicted nucleotidyltransferase